jgi:hypothetical protein
VTLVGLGLSHRLGYSMWVNSCVNDGLVGYSDNVFVCVSDYAAFYCSS